MKLINLNIKLDSLSTMSRAKMSPICRLKFRESVLRMCGCLPSNLYFGRTVFPSLWAALGRRPNFSGLDNLMCNSKLKRIVMRKFAVCSKISRKLDFCRSQTFSNCLVTLAISVKIFVAFSFFYVSNIISYQSKRELL